MFSKNLIDLRIHELGIVFLHQPSCLKSASSLRKPTHKFRKWRISAPRVHPKNDRPSARVTSLPPLTAKFHNEIASHASEEATQKHAPRVPLKMAEVPSRDPPPSPFYSRCQSQKALENRKSSLESTHTHIFLPRGTLCFTFLSILPPLNAAPPFHHVASAKSSFLAPW